ncbi:MAG: WD40 repeat domain-containing protein [Solirubrobacteraceae bacterium]
MLAVAVTSEGQVTSGVWDGTVRTWDPHCPGNRGRELGRHDGPVWAVAVSGEGQVICGGDDGTVRLWGPRASGDPGRELAANDGPVRAVTATGDESCWS